jgi:2-dehydro-3-deoxy-D-arabinonate dehydratase
MSSVVSLIDADQALARYETGRGPVWGLIRDGRAIRLDRGLTDLLRLSASDAEATLSTVAGKPEEVDDQALLAPIESQEVWAAGVTYERSREARLLETREKDVYDRVYESERPELFFKARGERVVRPLGDIGIRRDSSWDVPEPELALVLNSSLELFGFTIGNDVSSRSIEGDNPLYLPQAKVYDGSCCLGPAILPAWATGRGPFRIEITISRGDVVLFHEVESTERMARRFDELASWLGRATSFPDGVVLLTGTGIVPAAAFSLLAEDRVEIRVAGIGRLVNAVIVV